MGRVRITLPDSPAYFPVKMTFDPELDGFIELILEQAGFKIGELKEPSIYVRPSKYSKVGKPTETPTIFRGNATGKWTKDNPTTGDYAYSVAKVLSDNYKYDRSIYQGIVKDGGKWTHDYIKDARALIYDLKGLFYPKFRKLLGHELSKEEFTDCAWDLKISDLQNAIENAHGGIYAHPEDNPWHQLAFDLKHMTLKDAIRIITAMTSFKQGGKLVSKCKRKFSN